MQENVLWSTSPDVGTWLVVLLSLDAAAPEVSSSVATRREMSHRCQRGSRGTPELTQRRRVTLQWGCSSNLRNCPVSLPKRPCPSPLQVNNTMPAAEGAAVGAGTLPPSPPLYLSLSRDPGSDYYSSPTRCPDTPQVLTGTQRSTHRVLTTSKQRYCLTFQMFFKSEIWAKA